ncbi:MAG: AMP-binding protein [Chloroflexia bacterium]
MSSLPNWLSYHAASTPNSTALVAVGGRWTFAELNAWAASIGGGLLQQGVRTGDRAAVLMDNGPEYFALIHALMRIACARTVRYDT